MGPSGVGCGSLYMEQRMDFDTDGRSAQWRATVAEWLREDADGISQAIDEANRAVADLVDRSLIDIRELSEPVSF